MVCMYVQNKYTFLALVDGVSFKTALYSLKNEMTPDRLINKSLTQLW